MRIFFLTTALVLAGAVAFFMFRAPLLVSIGDYLVVEDQLHPSSVIHVIAGPDYRTEYAIHLYMNGLGNKIFFTGGWCEIHQDFHGERGQRLSLAEGIPAIDIAYDDSQVTSTYSEALLLKEFIDQRDPPVKSVIVVSDPYHMRRARWTFRKVLGEGIEIQMAPVPFDQTPYLQPWWTDSRSKKYVLDEYKKTVYYLLRYQLPWRWANEWLASLDKD